MMFDQQGPEQVDSLLFAKLLAINNPHFDFDGSNFSAKNMSAKDRYRIPVFALEKGQRAR
jgi:hypothetical protein